MSTTVTINGMEWSVYFVDKSYPALTDDSGTQDAYGVAHFRTCDIYIDCGLPKELMRQTVTHELVHALRFSYGESLDLESEEKICDFIAAHFDELILISNNPIDKIHLLPVILLMVSLDKEQMVLQSLSITF